MRTETITCDICGEGPEKGRIEKHYIIEPHIYVAGNAPFNKPSRELDMHKPCADEVRGIVDAGWPIVLREALKGEAE